MLRLRQVGRWEIKELYDHMRRDFPLEERPPYYIIKNSLIHGRIKADYLIEEGGTVCGYAVSVLPADRLYCFIQFFAILPEYRSKGYGSTFLELVSKRYKRKLLLEVEDPDAAETEEELVIRRKRIKFYQRAGLRILDNMLLKLFGVPMLCMTNDPEPVRDLEALWKSLYHQTFGNTWPMSMVQPIVFCEDAGLQTECDEEMGSDDPILPGRYRHFKGGEYQVLYKALHSETNEPMVVYQALYGNREIWVRPAGMWKEKVSKNGEMSHRFRYLGRE